MLILLLFFRLFLQNTLVIAQSAADEVKNTAKQQADQIIKEAEANARKSVDELSQEIPYIFGDKIAIKGLNGTKKVKDVFIDKKIPLDERDSWPIVVDSLGEVVWIPGIKKSKFDKKSTEDYDIILKYN